MKEFLSKNIIPILLNTVVVSSMAYIYTYGDGWLITIFTLFSLILSATLFVLFEFLRNRNKLWLSTVAVSTVLVFAMTAAGNLLNNDAMLWFMEPARFTVVYVENIAALVILAGTVLGACVYYFTRIRYRRLLVFLICICTFALFAKTFTDIPVIYTILITTLYFMLMIDNNSGEGILKNKSFYLAAGFFIIAVTVIASFFPKIESAPYREEFDELITGINIGGNGRQDFNSFTDSSANTTPDDDGEIVFYVFGDNPILIKRQCFDLYSADVQVWTYGHDNSTFYTNRESYTVFENPSLLMEASGFESKTETELKTTLIVLPEDTTEPMNVIYTAESIADIYSEDGGFSDADICRNISGEYNFSDDTSVYGYNMSWYDIEVDEAFTQVFSDTAAELYSENDAVSAYISAKREASVFKTIYGYEASSYENYLKVKEIVTGLTASVVTDYGKASAICDYLKNGDYRYDENFRSVDPSVDNFILNTKRGVCYNFATAMTLMCREAGLNARYVEGFLVSNYDEEIGGWVVRSTDAHAYVQVWIDGYGWTDFDPTASIIVDENGDNTFVIVGISVILIALVSLLVITLRPVLAEKAFLRRMRRSRGGKQAVLIYGRICEILLECTGEKENTYTPEEISEKCRELFGLDISGFIEEYRACVYGGEESGADNGEVYRQLKKAVAKSGKKTEKS